MRKLKFPALGLLTLAVLVAGCASMPEKPVLPFLDQGSDWNSSTREAYYTQDQGSQLIPLNWFMALRQPNGELFARDSLARYGYLPNPKSPVPGLAVGFTTNQDSSGSHVGMTCSACHTRQIYVAGQAYRIDGGPAISDFQTFLADLDQAVGHVLNNQPAFDQFSQAVLGANANQGDKTKLRADLSTWYTPYHAIVKGSLPLNSPWGPSRLDAVSMIFNRLTGLDIGPAPTYIIEENIKLADAPARYPFLWNAAIQDHTQWPGFSLNGNLLLGLTRNAGEVIGVFGKFHPVKDPNSLLGIDYVKTNSMNFPGLNEQEITIGKLGPPKWPWPLDKNLVAQGEKVFNQKDHTNQSCADCHGIKKGEFRSLFSETWATPILDVGTDSREVNLLGSQVKTGVLEGAKIIGQPLKPVDSAFAVLALAVEGSILQHYFPPDPPSASPPSASDAQKLRTHLQGKFAAEIKSKADTRDVGQIEQVRASFKKPDATASDKSANASGSSAAKYPYESRVMQGIWAVAPYLHNGSVPTLTELLKPAAQRVASFKVGPEYDIERVGLAAEQSQFNFTLKTTDCSDRNSGNSRCGHEFGTQFSETDKRALLEYLKQL